MHIGVWKEAGLYVHRSVKMNTRMCKYPGEHKTAPSQLYRQVQYYKGTNHKCKAGIREQALPYLVIHGVFRASFLQTLGRLVIVVYESYDLYYHNCLLASIVRYDLI